MPNHAKSEDVHVVVTAPGGALNDHAKVLESKGMKIDSMLETIGIITGSVPQAKLAKIKAIPGLTIERDEPVQLPPPDASLQ